MTYIKPSSNQGIYTGSVSDRISPPKYTGKETDTMEIIVNNERATIEGNVKWKSFLGETADKAFPGDKGLEHHEQIVALIKSLNAEIKRATEMDNALSALISVNNQRNNVEIERVRNDLNTLTANVNQYVAQLNTIRQSLEEEIDSLESSLIEKIEVEREERIVADGVLSKKINDVLLAEVNDKEELSNRIDEVSEQLESVDGVVSNVDTVVADAVKEVSDTLNESILNESTIREESDKTLERLIQEANTSLAAVIGEVAVLSTSLKNSIPRVEGDIEKVSNALTDALYEEERQREAADTETNIRVNSLSSTVDNLIDSVEDIKDNTDASIYNLGVSLNGINIRLTQNMDALNNRVNDFYSEYSSSLGEVEKEISEAVQPVADDVSELEKRLGNEISRAVAADTQTKQTTDTLSAGIAAAVKKGEDELAYVWDATSTWIKELEVEIDDVAESIDAIDLIDGGSAPVLHYKEA